MIWQYRVFHDQAGYSVHVVLYERDGALIGYHKEPAVPGGRTAEELAQDIEWFNEAFDLPILTIEELEVELANHPPKPRQTQGKRKTLEELESELVNADRTADDLSAAQEAVPAD